MRDRYPAAATASVVGAADVSCFHSSVIAAVIACDGAAVSGIYFALLLLLLLSMVLLMMMVLLVVVVALLLVLMALLLLLQEVAQSGQTVGISRASTYRRLIITKGSSDNELGGETQTQLKISGEAAAPAAAAALITTIYATGAAAAATLHPAVA